MTRARLVVPVLAVLLWSAVSGAATFRLAPGADVQASVRSASEGDTLLFQAGRYAGPVDVEKRLMLIGKPGAEFSGGGKGSVLTIRAPGTRVAGLRVSGSGERVLTADAGIKVIGARDVALECLEIADNLYGIYLDNSPDCRITGCGVTGRPGAVDEGSSGNGIHLWFSPGVLIRQNRVTGQLDGIYISFSSGVRVERNRLTRNIRYGLHYMNCQQNDILANTFDHNTAGCAIMFSNHLTVRLNHFIHNRGSRTYGLLLRSCSDGVMESNLFQDNTIAVFMDDSNRNHFHDNLLAENGWGLYVFSSSEGNEFSGNDFIQNDYPVALDMRRTDNRFDDGKTGNYWSEAAPFDLDGDGTGDAEYGPVSAFAFLSKQYPDLALLARSPAVAALSAAERAFPALRPSEAVDRHPMLRPVTRGLALHGSAAGTSPFLFLASLGAFGGAAGALFRRRP